ncbi:Peptidylprolyl isomerase [Mycena sanguinolenta]|uniref:peptidylprolyl isomerase n=1 Tax=Mycena sanguinolenta TaxID=230812 RepID=A0A8H6ZCC8_9AGAR|nr:Peptidylprolyl isomerase [Mycena sanguinolenta]
MRVSTILSSLLFAAVAVLADAEAVPPTELQTETTFMPAECPAKAAKGDKIQVHYTGTLFSNGNKFDSRCVSFFPPLYSVYVLTENAAWTAAPRFPLTLGVGQVIKGWDQGLVGMCLNEKRTLTIPSELAYGSRGFGSVIPANSALVFTVELVGLESKTKHEEL